MWNYSRNSNNFVTLAPYSFQYTRIVPSAVTVSISGRIAGESVARGGLASSGSLAGRIAGASVVRASLAGAGVLSGHSAGESVDFSALRGSGVLAGRAVGVEYGYGNLAAVVAGSVTGRASGYSISICYVYAFVVPEPFFLPLDLEDCFGNAKELHLYVTEMAE